MKKLKFNNVGDLFNYIGLEQSIKFLNDIRIQDINTFSIMYKNLLEENNINKDLMKSIKKEFNF